ncbi:MAG: TatD family hydrolase [Chitinophagaceae bacterium]
MILIDTHCHLYLAEFDQDRQEVMSKAKAEGVGRFFLPAIDSRVIGPMVQMEKDFPRQCFAMMGLHPCSVKENYSEELLVAAQWLASRKFAAIGETGLDFYWDKTFVPQQYEAFRKQVGWAKEYKIPVVIHSRQSAQECIDVIKEMHDENLTGIFHCFGGSMEEALQIVELGFYMGIGGVITYKNSGLAAVIEKLPLDNIVLETDAPYLTPAPLRGKRNESAYLKYIVQKIAEVKKISMEEVAEATTFNARKVFGDQLVLPDL